jgi:hypothetical protein
MLNPKLLKLIEEGGLNKTVALVYCFCLENRLSVEDILPIINEDNESFLRINLTDRDFETNTFKLKYPLYVNDTANNFDKLLVSLKQLGFTSTGHPNNQLGYSVIDKTESTRLAFERFYKPDIDFDKLVKAVVNYYAKTTMPKKLENFFDGIAEMEYDSTTDEMKFL